MLTKAQWDDAQRRRARTSRLAAILGVTMMALFNLGSMVMAAHISSGDWRYLISAAASLGLAMPLVIVLVRYTERESDRTDGRLRAMAHQLNEAMAKADLEVARRDSQANRQKFESRLANALDMADGETEVFEVIERSVAQVLPEAQTELLLADNSQAHLVRMAAVGFTADEIGCQVDSPNNCPAARRAQVQVFADSDDLDACPKLRRRSSEHVAALCVPVSIMGRTVGVIHSTSPSGSAQPDDQVGDLTTLAKLGGARIGLMRAMAETQLQASTDNLTGLLNRRSFEQKLTDCRRTHQHVAVAMADLDRFKELNDTYGHETGDRALRLFARILRESLRSDDLVCRYGGEEFALAFPSCSVEDAQRALDKVREQLNEATAVSGLPRFTASFGVTEMPAHSDLPSSLARADTALFTAKREGRDRVVVDPTLHQPADAAWLLAGDAQGS
jgi:diguanylate cyclase (GGDEF)-like protein